MNNTVQTVAEMLKVEGRVEDGLLDELVHSTASEIGTAVNNEGLAAQIEFLLANNWSGEEILFKVRGGQPTPFKKVRVIITSGAWKGERGWITGPKNEVDANPITTDSGFCLCWFDSEIHRVEDSLVEP